MVISVDVTTVKLQIILLVTAQTLGCLPTMLIDIRETAFMEDRISTITKMVIIMVGRGIRETTGRRPSRPTVDGT